MGVQFTYHFSQVTIDRQGIQADAQGDYFISTVNFEVEARGRRSGPLSATVKQAAGTNFGDVLDVTMPEMFPGPFDHATFRTAAAWYVRLCVGPEATALRVRASENMVIEGPLDLVLPWSVALEARALQAGD